MDPEKAKEPVQFSGVVKTVIFRGGDGFVVFTLASEGKAIPVTAQASWLAAGESVHCEGKWVCHPKYGWQVRAKVTRGGAATSSEGMRRYLSWGLAQGVGEKTADAIVNALGEDTSRVLTEEPEKLEKIAKVGTARAQALARAWQEKSAQHETMAAIAASGATPGLAMRIFKHFGADAALIVRSDPFRLMEVAGVGFRLADGLAQKAGLAPDAPARLRAALGFVLEEAESHGHTAVTQSDLVEKTSSLLGVEAKSVSFGLEEQILRGEIATRVLEDDLCLSRPFTLRAEKALALSLLRLHARKRPLVPQKESGEDLDRLPLGFSLSDEQEEAVRAALAGGLAVITGGPGTGKSTLTRAITGAALAQGKRILLAAPTGRAAKRLSEATGLAAQTLHRALGIRNGYTASHTLDVDLVIVDEASMMDTFLAKVLAEAMSPGAGLVLVGDVDQLPPVGPGKVLADLIASGVFPVARLKRIYRQKEGSAIARAAHAIRGGVWPGLSGQDEFVFVETDGSDAAHASLLRSYQALADEFGKKDTQVLSPMRRGPLGTGRLNQDLQPLANPGGTGASLRAGDQMLKVGDRVVQTSNHYAKEIFNGDLGEVLAVIPEKKRIEVFFDERAVTLEGQEIWDLELAYASTVHRAQGNEFTAVAIPLVTGHALLLERKLLYTALTRAKKKAVIVGQKKALWMAIKSWGKHERRTGLKEALLDMMEKILR